MVSVVGFVLVVAVDEAGEATIPVVALAGRDPEETFLSSSHNAGIAGFSRPLKVLRNAEKLKLRLMLRESTANVFNWR